MDEKKPKLSTSHLSMSKSRTSRGSREQSGDAFVEEEFEFNLPNEPTSEMSVNSYLSCYCGCPAPMKMAWTEYNAGRRFLGCSNYKTRNCGFFDRVDKEMKPCERVYEFYLKIQELKRENENMKNIALLQEKKIEELKELNGKLKNSFKIEMEKKGLSMKKKCAWGIVLFVIYVIFVKVLH